jgi:short-subunit dehydrogenase involved in D-alanine esterification of teichoic acids
MKTVHKLEIALQKRVKNFLKDKKFASLDREIKDNVIEIIQNIYLNIGTLNYTVNEIGIEEEDLMNGLEEYLEDYLKEIEASLNEGK